MDEEMMQDVKEQLAGALDYDQAAKGVLSQKMVLAYILKRTVPNLNRPASTILPISTLKERRKSVRFRFLRIKRTQSDMPWSDRIHRRSKGHRMKITA